MGSTYVNRRDNRCLVIHQYVISDVKYITKTLLWMLFTLHLSSL